MLLGCISAGTLVALSLGLCLVKYGAQASVMNHHIFYRVPVPEILWLPGAILYLIATVVPFFFVSLSWGWLFGLTFAVSYAASLFFYYETMVSVWCFFTAILSILILAMVK